MTLRIKPVKVISVTRKTDGKLVLNHTKENKQ